MRKYRYTKIREGLVGHWRPSRGPTGSTLIDSIRGNHGTLTNGPTWTPSAGGGTGGYALSFDGTDDYVNIPARVWPQNGCTACAWVYQPSLSTGLILSNWMDTQPTYIQFAVISDGSVFCRWFNNGGNGGANWIGRTTSTNAIAAGQWNFVTATWDGSTTAAGITITVLRTGGRFTDSANSNNGTFTAPQSTSLNLWLGRQVNGGATNAPLNGRLDDIAIFSRPLASSEILTLYQAGRGALDQRVKKTIVRGVTLAPSSFKAAWTLGSNLVLGI